MNLLQFYQIPQDFLPPKFYIIQYAILLSPDTTHTNIAIVMNIHMWVIVKQEMFTVPLLACKMWQTNPLQLETYE